METLVRTLICPHCHAEMETSGAFCTECGARLNLQSIGTEASAAAHPAVSPVAAPSSSPAQPVAAPPSTAAPTESPLTVPAPSIPAAPAEIAVQNAPVFQRAAALTVPTAPIAAPVAPSADAPPAIDLTPEQWLQVLTAVGHYAGLLRNLHMDEEGDRVSALHLSLLRQVALLG